VLRTPLEKNKKEVLDMNVKRFIGASVAVFFVFDIVDTFVNFVILKKTYEALDPIWRADMMSLLWIFHVAYLILAFLFTYIFVKGYENKGIAEGVRYGIIIGLFFNITFEFFDYAMFPLPLSLCVQWFFYGMIEFIIMGIVAAVIYKPNKI
jgi:hypothetical protein